MTGELTRGVVLAAMRRALRGFAGTRHDRDQAGQYVSRFMSVTINDLSERGLIDRSVAGENSYQQLAARPEYFRVVIIFSEAYHQLVNLGYVVYAPQPPGEPRLDIFVVTETGAAWAAGGDPAPEDSQGFLGALGSMVPTLDPVIKQYVQEALIAYDRQAFFAAAVMIGAASEKAVYLLMDALAMAVTDTVTRKAIEEAVDRRRLFTMLELLREQLQRARAAGVLPFSVHECADAHLLSLLDAIRMQRNEAVHPQAGQVTPVAVRLALSAFPTACGKVYDLIGWLQTNKIPKL